MRQLLLTSSSERLLFCGLLSLTFVSSAAIVAYHAHSGVAVVGGLVYTAVFSAFAAWLLSGPCGEWVTAVLCKPALWFVVLLALAAIDQRHYVKASALPDFASSAEALERPARLLLHGKEPYQYLIGGFPADWRPEPPLAPPISPGPGWVMLLSPLTVPHLEGLVAAVVLGFLLMVLAKKSKRGAGMFLVLLLAQPIFFFQAENGQDLYVISMALVIVSLFADDIQAADSSWLLLGIFMGFIATARVPLLLPVAVIGLGCFRKNRRMGGIFLATSMTTAIGLHLVFGIWAYVHGHFYQPLHVLYRGAGGTGSISRISVIVLLGLSLSWVWRRMEGNAASWCVGAFLVMESLFAPEAIKELSYVRALNWEGSTYITFPVPLLIGALVLGATAKSLRKSHTSQASEALTTS